MFRPTVVVDGRIVGTWRTAGGRLEVDPFRALPARVLSAARAAHDRLPRSS